MFYRLSTNPKLRSLMRSSGVLVLLKKILAIRASSYEEKFSNVLLSVVQDRDIVWDVGANIGYYTCKLAKGVGPSGRVVAFEPVSTSYRRMVAAYGAEGLSNVVPKQCALGHCDEQFSIPVTTEGDGVTNTLAKKNTDAAASTELITVCRGDRLIAEGVPAPTVIKIDVEAYEEEVIFGLRNHLQSGLCREVLCEVHFGQLAARGSVNAPRRIESLLKDAGFTVRWLDASHIQATRKPR